MTGNSGRPIVVQERDRRLLREIGLMRVVDREQAKIVGGFGSLTRVNARLLALTRTKLLRRFFLGTVGGARKGLYSLGQRGAELVGIPDRGPRRRNDEVLTVDIFTIHQLAINEIYCIAKFGKAPEGIRFARWIAFYESIDTGLSLIPDGYLEFATPAKSFAMFLEVDLGNESLSVWRRKIESYLAFATSGHFQEKFGGDQFRVLVVANSDRRLASLRSATAAATEKIFWFATAEAIRREGFWSSIWQRPKDIQVKPLI